MSAERRRVPREALRRALLGALFPTVAAGTAHADVGAPLGAPRPPPPPPAPVLEVATDPEHPVQIPVRPERERRVEHAGCGARSGCGGRAERVNALARLSGGRAFAHDVTGAYYGRLELEGSVVPRRRFGHVIGGMPLGVEAWGGKEGGGGSIPMTFYVGVATPAIMAVLGGGFSIFAYDRVDGRGGLGFLTPHAHAGLGVDTRSVRVLVEGRSQYRWFLGAPDRAMHDLGLSIALKLD